MSVVARMRNSYFTVVWTSTLRQRINVLNVLLLAVL